MPEPPAQMLKANSESILLFTVGGIDWLTFKPIVEALDRRSVPFRYITMDRNDPVMSHPVNCMTARYIGSGLIMHLIYRGIEDNRPVDLGKIPSMWLSRKPGISDSKTAKLKQTARYFSTAS